MVGYFLDYYGNNALEHLGWMVTASKALPHLYKHNLEHYVEDLFYKECFAEKELDSNFAIDDLITKEEMLKFRRAEFKAFKGNTKLKQIDIVTKFSLKQFTGDALIKCFGMMTSFTNNTSSGTMPPPIVLRVVPFPNFTLNSLPTQKLQEVIDDVKDFNMPNFLVLLKNIFKHIFVPRGYQVGRKKLDVLSPFAQVIKLDEDIFIFDNPAMEAIIDFRWNPARLHFLHSFILFSLYALSYGILCYSFITKLNVGSGLGILLITLVVYFYYAAYYLFFIEVKQMKHYGWRNYLFDIYNIFDLVTLFSPVFVMSLCLKTTFDFETGFIGVSNDPTLVTWMSFTILFMWCEFILYLRLFDAPCVYIYIVINILKTVWPFLLFMVVIIVAFAHTMFILLQNPTSIGYVPNVDSYSALNSTTNEPIDLAFTTDFDPNSTSDNPFSNFFTAIEATYFWINGDWSQRDSWNTWAIKALSMIGSIMLVSVMQNMFIAFMSGVFEEAASKGRYACLRFKADMIADYEALEHKKFYFWPAPNEPKYIYYVGHSDNLDEWKERSKDRRGCIFKRYESKNDFLQYKFDDDDLSTDKNSLWYFKKKRSSSGSISNRNSGIVSNNNIIIGSSNFDGNNNSFKSKSRMKKTPLRFQNNNNKSIIRNDADFNNTSDDNKDENRINKQLQENNQLIKNLNTKITSFDSEVAALKDLVKTLISELKDAKSNNGDRKDGGEGGDENGDDDETKKE